jgi:hypothetical protein
VKASGASAIGVPGWPDFAFSTASMDSVRMVLIESSTVPSVLVVIRVLR